LLEKSVGKLSYGLPRAAKRRLRERHGARRIDASGGRRGDAPSPRSFAASLEASLGTLVEIPGPLLVVAEIVILFRRRGRALTDCIGR